jgi:hypothetical protein
MTAYPLVLTVEHEEGEWSLEQDGRHPEFGYAVIRLNGHEVKKIELRYSSETRDREALERYAVGWLAGEPAHDMGSDVG